MINTIYKHEWIRFRASLWYFLLTCFLLTLIFHLFLGFPFRSVFIDFNGMNYMYWMIPGILITLSSLMAYTVTIMNMNNLLVYPKSIESICKTPVANWQVLAGITIWASTIGIVQWIISLCVSSLLNNEFYQVITGIRLVIQTIFVIPFFSVLAILTFLISKNRFWQLTASLLYFISLAFGLGCFIPLKFFPVEIVDILKIIPLTSIIEGAQNIIMAQKGSFTGGLFTFFITALLFLISVVISNKKFRY